MKFGEVLNSIKQGFDKMISEQKGPIGGISREDRNFDIHKILRQNLTNLVNQAQKTAEEIEKIENLKFQAEAAGRKDLVALYKGQLDKELVVAKKIEEERKKIEIEFSKTEKEIIDNRVKDNQKLKKSYGDLSNIEEDYTNKLKTLIEARSRGFISEDRYRKMAGNLDYLRKSKQILQATTQGSTELAQSFIGLLGNGLGTVLSKILPGFGIIIDGIVTLAKMAWKQMIEENDALINVMRSTAGIVNPASLGYNVTGSSLNGFGSLSADLIKANVDVEKFSGALNNLFSGPMGQIVGMKTNLKDSSGQLQNYAITAAKMTKLWGTDISETVANLTMDYGMQVGTATDAVESFGYSAKNLGLNMKFAMKNLEKVSAATTKYYFRSFDNMAKMAMLATNLGVDVDGLLDGTNKMNSLTDLYTKQQEAAAFEMSNYANNMAQIYALTKNGNQAEANKIKLLAAYSDLTARGFYDKRGVITSQGQTTLTQAGFNKEEIDALNRLGKLKTTGVSAQVALNPEMQTQMDKNKIRQYELENRTIMENLTIMLKEIFQPIIDLLKNLLGPIIEGLVKGLVGVGEFVGGILNFVNVIVSVLVPIVEFVGGILEGLGDVFSEMGGWFNEASKWLSKFSPYLKIASGWLKWLGKEIGLAAGTIIKWILNIVGQGLILIGGALKLFWNGLVWVSNLLYRIFYPVIWIVEQLYSIFKPLIDIIIDFCSSIGEWLGITSDSVTRFTNDLTKSDDKIVKAHALDDKVWSEIYKGNIQSKVAPDLKKGVNKILAPIGESKSKTNTNLFQNAFDLTKQKGYKQPVVVNNNIKVDGVFSNTGTQTLKTH